jgi:hypothetical protein
VGTDKGESGEKGWLDDLPTVDGEPVSAIGSGSGSLPDQKPLPVQADSRHSRHPWAAAPGDRSWHRLAWSVVALLAVSTVLGLTCAVWLADRTFSQLNQTERNIASLINSAQASSQAFAVSQTQARQALVSSQILLNQSEAQKNREQAKLDRSMIALTKAQEATQQADAQLAYAEAALDEERAHQVPSPDGPTVSPADGSAGLARESRAAQQADTALVTADGQLDSALARLADAQAALKRALPHPGAQLATTIDKLILAEAAAQRAAARVATAQTAARAAADALTSGIAAARR